MKIKKVSKKPSAPIKKRAKPKNHKYGAVKKTVDGHTFPSKMEADYYVYLKGLQQRKIITDIELQPKLELQPKFKYKNKNIQAINYVLDFKVTYADGKIEYIDIKGMETPVSTLKLKMVKYLHQDITFKILTKSIKYGVDGWIEYDELKKIRRENNKLKGK